MQLFEVVLTQKIKRTFQAESASEALQSAMLDVKTENQPFTPTNWTVKEKEQED